MNDNSFERNVHEVIKNNTPFIPATTIDGEKGTRCVLIGNNANCWDTKIVISTALILKPDDFKAFNHMDIYRE
jgi:CRISPR/Cas system CSM-associated protein Csm5 (group 7 of RAMP superfamily)